VRNLFDAAPPAVYDSFLTYADPTYDFVGRYVYGRLAHKFGDRGGALNAPRVVRVVVVDNNASVRGALEELLTAAGYEVDTHASAESFLESGRLSSADCLLLDVEMPGMSGVELQEQLDRLDARIPIVFMTGHGKASIRNRALAAGVVEFLEKPFSDRALLGAIERALRAAPP